MIDRLIIMRCPFRGLQHIVPPSLAVKIKANANQTDGLHLLCMGCGRNMKMAGRSFARRIIIGLGVGK